MKPKPRPVSAHENASPPSGLSRRRFVRRTLLSLATVPIALSTADWLKAKGGRFFTDREALALDALCDRIIPTDQYPGAAWAGVVEFIDRKLEGYHRRHQNLYRSALATLNEACLNIHKKPVTGLTEAQRDELLHQLENGEFPAMGWKKSGQKQFFDRLVDDTMQGFYGGPRHGGNRDAVSWRMLGLPEPPVRSRRPANGPSARKVTGA